MNINILKSFFILIIVFIVSGFKWQENNDDFNFQLESDDQQYFLIIKIKNGSYIYKDNFEILVNNKKINHNLNWTAKEDPYFGRTFVLDKESIISIKKTKNNIDSNLTITLKYRGCNEKKGICYPIKTKKITHEPYKH